MAGRTEKGSPPSPLAAAVLAAVVAVVAVVVVAAILMLVGRGRDAALRGCLWARSRAQAVVGCVRDGLAPTELRVMTFNLWGGGLAGGQPLEQSAEVIRRAAPSVVGLQEPAFANVSRLAELARLAGMAEVPEANLLTSLAVASAWRVGGSLPNNRGMGGAELLLEDGRRIFVYNVHLTAYPYGPHAVRDGRAATAEAAVRVEEPREREIAAVLEDMERRLPEGARVLLLGDFNAPSHRDWAVPTARTYGLAVPWPVTLAIESAGFTDAFRLLHPSPEARPGFTYSPVSRADNDHVPSDRIDMVFARGPGLRVCEVLVVGEPGPLSDVAVSPWPSDHRAVLASLDWDDAEAGGGM